MPKFDKVKAAFVAQKDRLVAAKHLDVTTHAKAVRDDAVSIVCAPFRFVGDILAVIPAAIMKQSVGEKVFGRILPMPQMPGLVSEVTAFDSAKEVFIVYAKDATYMPVRMITDLIHLTASLVGLVASVVVAGAKGTYKQTIGRLVGAKTNTEAEAPFAGSEELDGQKAAQPAKPKGGDEGNEDTPASTPKAAR